MWHIKATWKTSHIEVKFNSTLGTLNTLHDEKQGWLD